MGMLLEVGAADAQAVDLDVTADLHTAHRPPHGSALGIARPLDSVDDAGKAGDRRGQRGAVDAAEASGPAAHVRHDGNKGAVPEPRFHAGATTTGGPRYDTSLASLEGTVSTAGPATQPSPLSVAAGRLEGWKAGRMNGDEQLLRGRVYGHDHVGPNPGHLPHQTGPDGQRRPRRGRRRVRRTR
ncbi:hypothetical protein ACIOK4_44300 [Streptomyces bottropensis]|uniref:hypothetical protein n=1 Tax=Streptomyces bottropensis TaxID=42235 RepID=UPI0037F8F646